MAQGAGQLRDVAGRPGVLGLEEQLALGEDVGLGLQDAGEGAGPLGGSGPEDGLDVHGLPSLGWEGGLSHVVGVNR